MARSKHRRRPLRFPGYDYRDGGKYAVTMCTRAKECIFGEIRNGIMGLNELGCIVAYEIQKTSRIRPYVDIETWVVMPNHVHMIIHMNRVGASWHDAPTTKFLKAHSLGSIIGQLKIVTTKRINQLHNQPGAIVWQRNYYEHICRTPEEAARVQRYILNNPAQWSVKHSSDDLLYD